MDHLEHKIYSSASDSDNEDNGKRKAAVVRHWNPAQPHAKYAKGRHVRMMTSEDGRQQFSLFNVDDRRMRPNGQWEYKLRQEGNGDVYSHNGTEWFAESQIKNRR